MLYLSILSIFDWIYLIYAYWNILDIFRVFEVSMICLVARHTHASVTVSQVVTCRASFVHSFPVADWSNRMHTTTHNIVQA